MTATGCHCLCRAHSDICTGAAEAIMTVTTSVGPIEIPMCHPCAEDLEAQVKARCKVASDEGER
jgi:hypothetical protein